MSYTLLARRVPSHWARSVGRMMNGFAALVPGKTDEFDNWSKQQDDQPSRSVAIRRLLDLALDTGGTIKEAAPWKTPSGTKNVTEFNVAIRRVAGFQIRAGRAVLGWSAEDLARRSSVSLRTIRRAELADVHTKMTAANEQAIRQALEAAGVEFIDENGGGRGVRLRKRQQNKG
jgi:hypothetical protein